ncbi:MAG: DUF3916 domain-containing protein [Cyanobacteria bacterium P01_A01_bin.83]
MSRQISVSRRYSKIRGVKRRLNALDSWAKSFEGYFPPENKNLKYWNRKIPVLDILVSPPKTTKKIQARCLNSLIQAANHLLDARPSKMTFAKVTVLITYPDMFGSEICIFFDPNYFDSFFDIESQDQSLCLLTGKQSLADQLGVNLPEIYEEVGFEFKSNDNGLNGLTDYIEQWWSIREKK